MKHPRPCMVPLEGFKVGPVYAKIVGRFVVVELVHKLFYAYVRYKAWETQWLWMEIFIISASDAKNLQILALFRGGYQLRQMKIKARVGKQHQLG